MNRLAVSIGLALSVTCSAFAGIPPSLEGRLFPMQGSVAMALYGLLDLTNNGDDPEAPVQGHPLSVLPMMMRMLSRQQELALAPEYLRAFFAEATSTPAKIAEVLSQRVELTESMLAHIRLKRLETIRECTQESGLPATRALLAAAWIAWYTVDLEDGRNAARDAAWRVAGVVVDNTPWAVASDAVFGSVSSVTMAVSWDRVWADVWGAAAAARRVEGTTIASNAIGEAVSAKLQILGLVESPQERCQKAYALAELRALLWLYEENNRRFKDMLGAAYAKYSALFATEAAEVAVFNCLRGRVQQGNGGPYITALLQFLEGVRPVRPRVVSSDSCCCCQ